MLRGFGLTLALVAGLVLTWWGVSSPWPRGDGAPAEAFAAGRAFKDVEVIAKTPHPTGSPANAAVRDYLVGRMTALGLSPRVEKASAFSQRDWQGRLFTGGANVENIVGVLPGKDRGKPAVAVMAHYDSVPGSPGAADDAAGTAAALEIARALKTMGTPERDVIFLLTDGEEAGLVGARAFFEGPDPLAAHVGAVINMEARGGGGRANMFQTGAGNGEWVKLFARDAKKPIASSLTVFLYEHMPNDTDFTVSKAKGLPGLNFAFIGREFDYHSASSTPAALDKGSLQHIGEQGLAATRAAAFAPALPGKSADLVYSQVFGDLIAFYPVWGGWVLLAVAAALVALGFWRARQEEALPWVDVAKGVGLAVHLLALSGAVLNLAQRANGSGFGWIEHKRLLAAFGAFETALVLLAVAAVLAAGAAAAKGRGRVAMTLFSLLLGGAASLFGAWDVTGAVLGGVAALTALLIFAEPIERPAAWGGILLTGLVLALVAQVLAPLTAFLIVWPLLLGGVAAAVTALGHEGGIPRAVLRWVIAVAALGWLGVYFHGLAQGLDMPAALAPFGWLWALTAWPLAQSKDDNEAGVTAVVLVFIAGFAIVAFLRFVDPWSGRHPQPTKVVYVADQTDGTFWRMSLTPKLDPWSRSVLTTGGAALTRRDLKLVSSKPLDAARAPAVAVPLSPPLVTRLPDGQVEVRAAPAAGGDNLVLELRSTVAAGGLTIAGKPAKGLAKPNEPLRLFWRGPEGVTVRLRPSGPGTLTAEVVSMRPGWPPGAAPLPARPREVGPNEISNSLVVRSRGALAW